MISFKFIKKPIVLDCYTKFPHVHQYSKIEKAVHFLPDWWKNIPKEFLGSQSEPEPTMRTCAGFLDLYGAGIVIPLWSDLQITVRQDGSYSWIFADRTSSITDHPTVMMGDIKERTRCSHAKILSPWAFSCKEDIKWHYTQPLWNQDMGNDFAIVPGVIDFKYQHTTSTNIFLRVPKIGEKGIFLKRNTPLAHLVPMSDRPLKIYNHMVSEEEYLKLVSANAVGTFVRRYLSDRKIRESQEQNKCPFSWMR